MVMLVINWPCAVCVLAVYLVDIWNMIEAFREAGLSSLDPAAKVPLDVLEMLLNCVFCVLNKRLPNSAQIGVADSVHSLFSFLVCAYDVYVSQSLYCLLQVILLLHYYYNHFTTVCPGLPR